MLFIFKLRLLQQIILNKSLTRSCVYHRSFLQNWRIVKGWEMNTKPQGWCTLGWCWSSLASQSLSPSSGCYQPPCAPAPRELCRPLCSSLQSRIAMLSCCTGWHPRGYWQHRAAEGSGGLCASVNHSYHASSPLQKLLLWEKKHLFPCEVKQSFFSMSKKLSVWFE